MQNEKQPQESSWEENILNALYYAFAASDAEGRAYFLNLVLENFYKRSSFLAKLYEEVAAIRTEGIFEVSEETWSWVEFWRQFDLSDKEKIPAQIERLQTLQEEEALSRESQGILHFLLAVMEYERGEYDSAARLYEQSTQFLPDFSWTYNNWGNSLGRLNQHKQAIEKYQKALKLDSEYALAYNNWGWSLDELDQYEQAIEKFQKAIELDPKIALAYHNWGLSLGKLGLHEQAIEKYPKAIELDPKYAKAFSNWGWSLGELGYHEHAIEKLQKAIELNPKYARAYELWGWNLDQLGQHEQAIEKYRKAVELDPKSANAYHAWCYSLYKLGHYEQAIEKIPKAIELDPKDTTAYNNWGYLAIITGKLEEALEKLQQAIELNEKDYLPLINFGIAYYRLHQNEQGKKYFAAGLENCHERSVHCQLRKATALLGLERTEEAKAQLQETVAAFKLAPNEQNEFMADWQLLATAPAPPAGMEEFMALAKKLFGEEE
jgi:tetratricopeptide (TPR) repeat protein